MKSRNIACIATVLLASLTGVKAASTLTAWTFDNAAIGLNGSPPPSTGLGTASALGMNNSYNNTNSVSNPDIQSLAGSSSGLANSWRIRGGGAAPNGGNGWSTNAPIGTQGAQFTGSTFGYYQIKVSFDVYATADAEANLQVQYSTDGSTWFNATIASALSGIIANNNTSPSTVNGSYIKLVSGWNNQVTVNLTGLSGVDNNASFAIRIVNASTGADCVDTTGAIYNNTTGNWTLDNVVIQGASIDTIADWNFDLIGVQAAPYNNPAPTIGSGTAQSLGMINNYTNSDGSVGSGNWCDITAQAGSSTGPNSLCWRVRGGLTAAGVTGSGWNSAAPIGTQGAEFDVSTAGYTNIICTFDVYFTTQAPDKIGVVYTTDGWVTMNVANTFYYGANPAFILNNNSDPDLLTGTYFYETFGQGWYNNFVVDLTGDPATANNPLFGFRVVNAATGAQCQNFLGQPYNNQSGNVRFGNVVVGGTSGTLPPAVAFDPNATVDNPFTNTYTDNPAWRTSISAIYVNGLILTNAAYTTTTAGKIIFNPAKSALLQASGLLNISIIAQGFGTARVPQPLAAGVATKLAFTTQAAGPSASGGTLTANPVFLVSDQYGNGTTNPYPNVTITAAAGGAAGWTLGGATQQTSTNGLIAFTNLTATVNGSTAVAGAQITFSITGYTPLSNTNSAMFTIGAPPVAFTPGNLAVLQIDTTKNNTTFSIIEVSPSTAGQTAPVNIVPISATGPNALRLASAGSTGRLALSDDGTLLCFAAFADGSAATPDETLNLNRAAAALNSTHVLTVLGNYTSISLGGSEARAACVLDDDSTWIVVDKGGLYQGFSYSGNIAAPNLNNYNNVAVRTFGGSPWVETQKAVSGRTIPALYELGYDPSTGLYDVTFANNLGTDQYASDFYMISTNGGASYDVLYIADQVSGTQGIIKKMSLVGGNWTATGSFTNSTGIDGLFAATNSDGGVNLFYTTGSGGTANNSIVRVTDAAGWNQNINITSSNVLYTATGSTSLKGLTFAPQAMALPPLPPPVLTAATGANTNGPFSVATTPDDPAWRAAITSITVNGSTLSAAAYDTNQVGQLVFTPAQSALLQTTGNKTIVIAATGYGPDTVVQTIGGTASKLAYVSPPSKGTAGTPFSVTVQSQDASGNPSFPSSPTTITLSKSSGGGTLSGTLIAAIPVGTANVTFSGLVYNKADVLKLTATATAGQTGLTPVTTGNITISAGAATQLVITTQPAAPIGNGGVLATAPVVKVEDQYGNVTSSTAGIAALPAQGTWTLGGPTALAAVAGVATFNNLIAQSPAAVTGATISFTSSGLTGATSSPFNIPAPIVLGGAGLTGGKFGFSFTSTTGLSYSVRRTNNVTAPTGTWPVIGPATESPAGSGHYQFSDPNPATNGNLFYRVSQP